MRFQSGYWLRLQSSEDLTGDSRICFLEDSVTRLLAGPVPCCMDLFTDRYAASQGSWQPQSQKWSRESKTEDTVSFTTYHRKSHTINPAILYSLEASHQIQLSLKKRGLHKVILLDFSCALANNKKCSGLKQYKYISWVYRSELWCCVFSAEDLRRPESRCNLE